MEVPRPEIPDQEYFNIGEACRIVQLPAHTLRYWEEQIGVLRPARLGSGHRRYTRRDLELLLKLKDMLRDRRMTLAGARRALLKEARGPRTQEPAAGHADANTLKVLREVRDDLKQILAELVR